jgi:DNA (cytosine-5)-methyltransferase 1
MRHGSLFSGIGGFDLASEWMGWENVFHCEWNPFGQKVLNYYFPNSITYNDITKTDFTIHRGSIDILTGGFPCQPYSSAGKRKGKEDERHLWPEMLRAIREVQPSWVVGENVRGLTNWNGGLVFDEVQADLEAEGYQVTPFLLPACGVNDAPHRRDRIWFIAYSEINRQSQSKATNKRKEHKQDNGDRIRSSFDTNGSESNASNSDLFRCDKRIKQDEIYTGEGRFNAFGNIDESNVNGNVTNTDGFGLWGQSDRIGNTRFIDKKSKGNNWENFPTVSPVCDGNDGISDRLDSITFSKWRNESIKAGGNAIVPQVVHQIFKAIEKYNELDKQLTI